MKKMVGIPSWLKSIVVTALLIAMMLLCSFVLKFGVTPSEDQGAWGQFGDFVGGILNPLFSIIGLLALLYTIVLQSEELRRSTRELKSSANALKRQNRHNARQQFDANFFQLLNIHRELTDRLNSDGKSGVKVIESKIFHLGWAIDRKSTEKFTVHEVHDVCDEWARNYHYGIDGYLDSLTNVISYIYFSSVGKRARIFAYTTLSSTMAVEERTLLLVAATFDPRQTWVRQLLDEDDFFRYCRTSIFNASQLWEIIRSDYDDDFADGTED